jgi:hypothetical protein
VAEMSQALRNGQRLELVGPTRHLDRTYYIGFMKSRSSFGKGRPPTGILVTCPGEGIVSQADTARELLHCAILASLLFHDRSNLVQKMGGNNDRLRSRLPAVCAVLDGDESLRSLTKTRVALETEAERQDQILERMFTIEGLFGRSSTPDTALTYEWIALYHEAVELYEALVRAFQTLWGSEDQRRNLKVAFRAERQDAMSMHDIFIDLKMMKYNIGELQRLLDRAQYYADSYMELWQPQVASLD